MANLKKFQNEYISFVFGIKVNLETMQFDIIRSQQQ